MQHLLKVDPVAPTNMALEFSTVSWKLIPVGVSMVSKTCDMLRSEVLAFVVEN